MLIFVSHGECPIICVLANDCLDILFVLWVYCIQICSWFGGEKCKVFISFCLFLGSFLIFMQGGAKHMRSPVACHRNHKVHNAEEKDAMDSPHSVSSTTKGFLFKVYYSFWLIYNFGFRVNIR